MYIFAGSRGLHRPRVHLSIHGRIRVGRELFGNYRMVHKNKKTSFRVIGINRIRKNNDVVFFFNFLIEQKLKRIKGVEKCP